MAPRVLDTRHAEQLLWRRFRAACDRVFERRAEHANEAKEERSANQRRMQEICSELESIVECNAEDMPDASRVRELEHEWAASGPVSRETKTSLEARFRDLLRRFDDRRRDVLQLSKRRRFEALRTRCEICARVEALLENCVGDGAGEALGDLQGQWDELPDDEPGESELLQGRFDVAADALRSGAEEREKRRRRLTENVEAKRDLCLRLEVLAGIESPSEYARKRMEFQVSRLSEAFGADRQSQLAVSEDDPQELERIWLGLGVLPAVENTALETRIARAWEVLLDS